MGTNKKYDFQVSEDESSGLWSAQILRRASSKRSVVSKMQDGFASKEEAGQWAQSALAEFLALNERNKKQGRKT